MRRSVIVIAVLVIVVITSITSSLQVSAKSYSIPSWIKNNAKWWSEGSIGDSDFLKGIQYLIDNNILRISDNNQGEMVSGSFDQLQYQSYPGINGLSIGKSFHDEFKRATLNPAGGYAIYTTAASGTGTAAINFGSHRASLLLITGATIGNDVDVRTSEYWLERQKGPDTQQEANRDRINFKVLFQTRDAKSTEGFVGIMLDGNSALTAVPTTAAHMGVYWDLSVNPNFILTSSDGTTQSTTVSDVAVNAEDHNIRVDWTGFNAARLSLDKGYQGGITHTVTALGSRDVGVIHFFVQTETSEPRQLQIVHWTVKSFGTFKPMR